MDKITKELSLHFGLKDMKHNNAEEEDEIDDIDVILAKDKIFAVKNDEGIWQRYFKYKFLIFFS